MSVEQKKNFRKSIYRTEILFLEKKFFGRQGTGVAPQLLPQQRPERGERPDARSYCPHRWPNPLAGARRQAGREGVSGNPTPPAAQPLQTRRPRIIHRRTAHDGSWYNQRGCRTIVQRMVARSWYNQRGCRMHAYHTQHTLQQPATETRPVSYTHLTLPTKA